MPKKWLGFLTVILFLVLLAGCETVKGFARGAGYIGSAAASTVGYTAEGAAKDTYAIYTGAAGVIEKTDNWMKDNLW